MSAALEGKDLTTGLPGKRDLSFVCQGWYHKFLHWNTHPSHDHLFLRRNSKEVGVDFSDILNIDLIFYLFDIDIYLFNT